MLYDSGGPIALLQYSTYAFCLSMYSDTSETWCAYLVRILSSMCSAPIISTSLYSPNVSGNCHWISLMIAYRALATCTSQASSLTLAPRKSTSGLISLRTKLGGKDIRLSKLDWGLDHVKVCFKIGKKSPLSLFVIFFVIIIIY